MDPKFRAVMLAQADQDIAASNAMIDSMLTGIRLMNREQPRDLEVRVATVLMYLSDFNANVDGALLVLSVALDRLAKCTEPS
jgi:hypothetical protein